MAAEIQHPIALSGVAKSFLSRDGIQVEAVRGIDLSVPAGKIVALVGPTGCGKSTILRLTAGLEEPDEGRIALPASGPSAVGYLTQSHTLFPWLTAAQNIGLPLEIRGEGKEAVRARSGEILALLGLSEAGDLYPYEMSGGMQQRAAMGRLLASDSRCWLLDEPFASLDERTRHRLQDELIALCGERGITILFVTHSVDEAVYLADRVHILSDSPGRVIETVDLMDPRPRNRLSDDFGGQLERIRKKLEEALA